VAKLFFLVSGEHETLPTAELQAILEAEGYPYRSVEKLDHVLKLEADLTCIGHIKRRAAFTRLCALELFTSKAEETAIENSLLSTDLKKFLKEEESFAVRIKRIKEYASKSDVMNLERKIGNIVKEKTKAKVNLRNPDKTFTGILTSNSLVFGLKLVEMPAKPFVERRPRKKPFFHPSAMSAKLTRCMVNLARPKAGELVLDPFCGTGSTLIEAALIGCRVVGFDVQRRMTRGADRNLKHFGIKSEGVLMADARCPPIVEVDCVVTDPPYGKSTITLKRSTRQIVEEMLIAVGERLGSSRRVCIAAPKTLNIAHLAATLGYKHLESYFVYVHRSLTREVAVFEKA